MVPARQSRTPEWTSDERFYGRLVTDNVHLFDSGDFSKRVCTVPNVARVAPRYPSTCVHRATCDMCGYTML
jgi:hypothetical protein